MGFHLLSAAAEDLVFVCQQIGICAFSNSSTYLLTHLSTIINITYSCIPWWNDGWFRTIWPETVLWFGNLSKRIVFYRVIGYETWKCTSFVLIFILPIILLKNKTYVGIIAIGTFFYAAFVSIQFFFKFFNENSFGLKCCLHT